MGSVFNLGSDLSVLWFYGNCALLKTMLSFDISKYMNSISFFYTVIKMMTPTVTNS